MDKTFDLAEKIIKILDNKKAKGIVLLDLKDITIISDYFIVCEGTSTTHIKTLCDEVEDNLKKDGITPFALEGYQSASWILADYGNIVVHYFSHEAREFYGLEALWSDAKRVDITKIIEGE